MASGVDLAGLALGAGIAILSPFLIFSPCASGFRSNSGSWS